MAKVVKSVQVEVIHTVELTNKELGYIAKLLGQCKAGGPTAQLYTVLERAHNGPLPAILNEERVQPIRFE